MTPTEIASITITRREFEVLDQISHGLTTKEIASKLYVSDHTIMSHRKNLLDKLSARNVAGMVRRAFEIGILSF